MRKVYGHKVGEKDKVHFKYSKVQSEYLDVMRELNRYRGDFNESYSIRSKLISTEKMSTDISTLIELNSDLLRHEKNVLGIFEQERKILHRTKSRSEQHIRANVETIEK